MAKDLVTQIYEFRERMLQELRVLGAPIPPKEPWMDAVDYNNELLDAVEIAREKAKQ